VGIKFIAATCNACEDCEAGDEAICASAKSSIYDVPGTFQQFAVAYTSQLTPIPAGLDMAVAAPILCAGLTVWRGVKTTQACTCLSRPHGTETTATMHLHAVYR
jgi:propanol-preferring alcohol dehydrogenase